MRYSKDVKLLALIVAMITGAVLFTGITVNFDWEVAGYILAGFFLIWSLIIIGD